MGVGASLAEEEGEEAASDLLGGSKGICADPESADDWKGGCDSRCMLVSEDSQCNSCGPEKNAQ